MDDEQQFCLKWNNHQSTLVSVFDSLLRRNQLLDCTLAAEGRSLKAHKVILSACSPYFESLLADYYDKHPVFILKDVKFKELEAMMDYMYRGEVNVSQDQLGPLLKAAESLQIKGLSDNRRESRSNNEDRKREPPILPPRERTPPPAPSLPQVKGLVIEQKKVDIMNMNNREGSQSPGRRKKRRRQSIDADAGNDSSIENHDGASNGSSSVSVSQPIVPPNVPLNDSRSELSAASSVKTKTEENMPQVPLKQKLEPHSELMLEPKSEYIEEDMNDDSIEDLTLDDDELDMDHNRPGPSHGGQGDGSNQGFGWQMDPSQDETFMAAQEAVGQHRDAQGRIGLDAEVKHGTKSVTALTSSPEKNDLKVEEEKKSKKQEKQIEKKTSDLDLQHGINSEVTLTSSPKKTDLKIKGEKKSEKKKKPTERKSLEGNRKRKKTEANESNVKKIKKRVTKKSLKTLENVEAEEDEEDEYFCIFCNEKYYSPPTEDWILCIMCQKWAHENCTSGTPSTDGYVCDFCTER